MSTNERQRLVGELRRNTVRRQRLENQLAVARAEGDLLIVQAHEAGVAKIALARVSGMTRQTIYSILLRAKAAA